MEDGSFVALRRLLGASLLAYGGFKLFNFDSSLRLIDKRQALK